MSGSHTEDEAPIDHAVLEGIRDRLQTSDEFSAVTIETIPRTRLLATYDQAYYPAAVERVHLEIRWFTNDDFDIHYHEEHVDDQWDCRWDRHPNTHNSREHYHPPPHGQLPAQNASFPDEHWDMLGLVTQKTRERITELWDQQS